MAHVAFLGTGRLGSAMIENLLKRGDSVTVWNRTAAKARALEPLGARVAERLPEALAGAERVHVLLLDDATVDAMLEQLAGAIPPEVVVIDHTTTGPAPTRARLERAEARGMKLLHAPMLTAPPEARLGRGLMLVSGAAAVYAEVEAALATMAAEVSYQGPRPDTAAALKLFANALLFVLGAGVADVLAMAGAIGVDARQALSVLPKIDANRVLAFRGEKMAARDYKGMFTLHTARKDLQLMLDAAGGRGLVVLPRLAARIDAAIAAGHGDDDLAAIVAVDDPA